MGSPPIKLLVVDDSSIARTVLGRIFTASQDVEVVATACNGQEALKLIAQTDPAVVCTDLHMPVMDGLELTQEIMANCPRPILVISSAVDEDNADNVFRLLNAGAIDIFPKPKSGASSDYDQLAKDLIRRVRVLAGVRVFRKTQRPPAAVEKPRRVVNELRAVSTAIVVMGASTGGPQAYHAILSQLPADFAVPLLCVQHIGEGFLKGLVTWLDSESPLRVKIAEQGESALPGTAYFAPDGRHLQVESNRRLITTRGEPLDGHRPSITHMFQSAATAFGRGAVGVLLTGMGRDGAEGLLSISTAGGTTIAQDEASCIVFGMPQRAIEMKAADHVLSTEQIASKLLRLCSRTAEP